MRTFFPMLVFFALSAGFLCCGGMSLLNGMAASSGEAVTATVERIDTSHTRRKANYLELTAPSSLGPQRCSVPRSGLSIELNGVEPGTQIPVLLRPGPNGQADCTEPDVVSQYGTGAGLTCLGAPLFFFLGVLVPIVRRRQSALKLSP